MTGMPVIASPANDYTCRSGG